MRASSLFVLLAIVSQFIYGETCDEPSFREKIEESDYIFSGKVVSREKDMSYAAYAGDHVLCGPKVAEIEVFQAWKGSLKDKVKVFSWDACDSLGTYFAEGKQYLVYANVDPESDAQIVDVGGCYTELLIESVKSGDVFKLDKKFNRKSEFNNNELVGVWHSYGNIVDKPFTNVKRIIFQFEKRYKFMAKTFKDEKVSKYKGKYYAKSGQVSIYDEDGPQDFLYRLRGDELVLETRDGEIKYHLKK